ncbi:TolB family protein [Solitalea lacus]|uniref:TolB family protein n=1 Tax=Solitalea lacus TaxID=2911172 RepID=UPI001EDBE6CE|nr:hypothetical protein [Solitalea lacus]UKJ06395.1 hypothetical protein L2B55_12710 [Solitalea lacus]
MRHLQKFKLLYISIFISVILTINSYSIFAQVFNNGQNPPSLKWQQINTENYQVIFPTGLEKEAERTANVLEHLYNYVGKSLKTKSRKISIILQNQSTVSNGFVTLAPRHSEFYTTPPQDLEPNNWINSLAIHELRHVVQIDKTTSGINIPLIEEIQFALFGGVFPIWFIEGDAVVTETALTSSGRGRLPDWEKEFRGNVLSGKNYSYSKHYFGSLKDNIPDYYHLGYYMAAKMRRDYSDSVFNSIFTRAKNKFYIPWPFSNSLKHHTGFNTNQFYYQTVKELGNKWENQLNSTQSVNYSTINKRKNDVATDYFLPKALNENEIVCIKKGLADVSTFFKIDIKTGKETSILTMGPQLSPHFDLKQNILIWDEIRFDPRYQYRNYSVICTYNLKTKEFKQLTKKSKYFSPSLSADGKTVVCVQVTENNQFNLVILDRETGNIIKTIDNPKNYFLQTPAFNADGNMIAYAVSDNHGRNLAVYDLSQLKETLLLDWNFKQSLRPSFYQNQLFYHSSYTGIDNIFKLDLASKSIKQLTYSSSGAYNATVDLLYKRLLFNNFSYRGQDISLIPLDKGNIIEVKETPSAFINYYQPIVAREHGKSVLDSFPNNSYKISTYKEGLHLINFHSLSPYAMSGDNDNYTAGISLKSNNLLNTMSVTLGYTYDNSVKSGEYNASIAYKKYYPIFSLNYTNRKRVAVFDSVINQQTFYRQFNFRENRADLSITVPLSFYKANFNYSIGLTSKLSYISRYNIENGPQDFIKEIKFPIDNTLYFYRTSRSSARDINPKWGQQISLRYNSFPLDDNLDGSIFTLESTFLFPGIIKHHSFLVSFNYQNNTGVFRNAIEIPQASGASYFNRTAPLENSLLFRYRFPLFYPDWELGRFAYIKRFKGGLFTDFENINNAGELKSYGLELRADCNLLRFYLPQFDIGTKMILFANKSIQSPAFELIFNFSL